MDFEPIITNKDVIYRLMALHHHSEENEGHFRFNTEIDDQFYFATLEECESHIAQISAKQEVYCFVVDTIPMGVNLHDTQVNRWVQFRDGKRYNVPIHYMYDESDYEEQRAIARIRERICGYSQRFPYYINHGK